MSIRSIDKLNQIKLKYGYSPQKNIQNRRQSNNSSFSGLESAIHQQIQQKIYASRMRQQHSQKYQKIPRESIKQTLLKATLPFYQNSNHSKNTKMAANIQTNITQFANTNVQLYMRANKNNHPSQIASQNQKNGFVESYQKTYDLLKNYRKRIRSTFQNKQSQFQQQSKHLNINSKKKKVNVQDKQNIQASLPKYKLLNDLQQPHKCQNSQTSSPFYRIQDKQNNEDKMKNAILLNQFRCSPLQGIDLNKMNGKSELSHIQKLQSKIQSILKMNGKK